jgi:dihydrolipoamide dehydrogenase
MEHFDVVVIGSGPGGYVSAIRCAQLGMKTAIIEKYNTLGGTCLNVGCIPSKSLLDSSHHYHEAVHNFSTHGIEIDGTIKVDLNKMISRKDSVVDQTTKGIDYLMSKNKIKVFNGIGAFEDNQTITINSSDKIKFSNAIIATGSKPISLPFAKIDKKRVISSTEALKLKEIPKKLIIIGGGVIGLELGQVYNRLGSEVSVIEYSNKITPFMDGAVSKELLRIFKKQKIKFYLSHKVTSVKSENNFVSVTAEDSNGTNVSFEGDYCLVSVGRKPYTDGLNLDSLGINTNQKGQIEVNDKLQTSVENIYAIGDVIKGPMLAHKAEEEGVACVEIINGQKTHMNYDSIPAIVYTNPEVASVGKTEEQLKGLKVEYKIGKFPFMANGRALTTSASEGFVKILADKKTDAILGAHIIGHDAGQLIAEIVTTMEFGGSAEDIARICHAHPTTSEAVKEAAMNVDGRAIHI